MGDEDDQTTTDDQTTDSGPPDDDQTTGDSGEDVDSGGDEGGGRDRNVLEDLLERERARTSELEDKVQELKSELEDARGDESEALEKLRAEKSELEDKVEQLRAESREQRIERELSERAQQRGVQRPDAVRQLVDDDEIKINDDGEVVGVEAELERVEEEYGEDMPNLFGRADDSDDDDDSTTTSAPDSGEGKDSDREEAPEEPETDEELGEALAEEFGSLGDDEDRQNRI